MDSLISTLASLGALAFGTAAYLDARGQRSDKEQEKRDRRTNELIDSTLGKTALFVRMSEYVIEQRNNGVKMTELQEKLEDLSDYVRGDSLPNKIADRIAQTSSRLWVKKEHDDE